MRNRIMPASIAVALLVAAPSLAQAQAFNQIGNSGKQTAPAPQAPPPPALPGAASTGAAAAPPSRLATDMEPTEALFDAINRGDIGAARDAISRGADLSGHNILGMTPMELSVDLGRNDISFLLLSMRGEDDNRGRQALSTQTKAKPPATRQAKQVPPRPAARVAASAPSQTARLFAGDGGTPNPNAGFLGFDSSRR